MIERRVRPAALAHSIVGALRGVGLPAADARSIGLLMAEADACGSDGDGISRLPQYSPRIKAGGINLRRNVRLVQEHPAMPVIDGDDAMGQPVMHHATELAITKAKDYGIGWVGAFGCYARP